MKGLAIWGAAALWAGLVIWSGPIWKDMPLELAVMIGFGVAGLPLMVQIGVGLMGRDAGAAQSAAMLVLAGCIWPLTGWVMGSGTVLALGGAFAAMQLLGLVPAVRRFAQVASFTPTVLAALWVLREGVQMLG
ncbi:hypothetical protein [Tropicibacter naphthalenivorans]|uniref:Uncharacterized protein n=1 Tax=Tropicibacter naphthalenivorans TaxID=441103 RepID=A0A0P1G432_9RHOB|nr:hypothetical protein [Tropicibacter naphthalenivorans]CUH76536.1 hypothetical protein TRN7648_00986 [Tropicibacter naphthalenivorans]SMC65520.1 hypothetical protein SAMN04488093_102632 [Tropicibacter naphthalenivorans]